MVSSQTNAARLSQTYSEAFAASEYVRGGVGFGIPFGHQSVDELHARTTFLGNLAVGYYFTEHGMVPGGDMAWFVSTNLTSALDHRGPNTNTFTVTPGFRVHLGWDWYGLVAVEVPVTRPELFDYQVFSELMKVW
jgi:hypothetical protein